ncbi:MAG: 6-phosphogluconolactonase [Pseudomonadota bacterium]
MSVYPEIRRYPDRAALAEGLADVVAAELSAAIAERGVATLAVPGGTTPGPFLAALAARPVAWSATRVMLTDERFVPETSDRSNTRLLRETFLAGAPDARLLPLTAEAERPEDVLDLLSAGIGEALPIDSLVLGMGTDMHTASLFPGADRLADALAPGAPVLLPMRAPGAGEPRLTLTARVLTGARHRHLLITGAEKRVALDAAWAETDVTQAPVKALLYVGIEVHHAD